ncbi:MAG: hypothetical protein EAY81_11625 [Bacteroidetes bacterium]|nr:MAG: hypothetical protein EAY81_11625 [Bacteroidota bacterium]
MKFLVSVLLLAVLASCNLTKFDRFPGEEQQAFPTAMQGNYQFVLPKGFNMFNKAKPGDTILLQIGADFTSDFMDNNTLRKLDSTYVLSLVNNAHYVLSVKDKTYADYWNCYVLALQKDYLKLYPVTEMQDKKVQKRYFNAHFVALKNETDSVFAYTQKDSAFARYFEREIKPVGGFKFTKLTPGKLPVKK